MDPLMDAFQAAPVRRGRRLLLLVALAALLLPAKALAAGWQGSFDASYRAASPGETIVLPAGTYGSQNITWIPGRDTAAPVKFVPAGPVTINGEMDISASGVWIAGTATGTIQNWKARTYSITVTSDVEIWGEGPSNYPRNVTVEGIDTRNLAVRSADNVTVRDMDVGPRLIDAPGCGPFENRIGANGSSGHAPNGVLWERVAVHDQNRTQAAANQDCHYGGLQWDYSQNVTIKDSVFERNVVYQVEVTGATNSTITGTSFSCPADNSWLGDRCDGQRPVQFRQGTWASFTLTNNLSANGPGGFYGCYESPCNFTGMTVSGNVDFPASTTAPTGGPPPPKAACENGLDDDGDGKIDYPADPGCSSASDTDERDPPPPACPGTTMTLTKISETATTITLGWQAVPNVFAYFFSTSAFPGKYSHTLDGNRTSVKFTKVPAGGCYRVQALGVIADGGKQG